VVVCFDEEIGLMVQCRPRIVVRIATAILKGHSHTRSAVVTAHGVLLIASGCPLSLFIDDALSITEQKLQNLALS